MQTEVQSTSHPASAVLMVVDDDDSARESVTITLMARGFRVLEHASGRTALEALQHGQQPDLILLDLVMPGMDGWEFRRRLSADALLADIPIVAMSGVCLDRAPPIEAAAFLAKPLAAAALLATMDYVLRADQDESGIVPVLQRSARARRPRRNALRALAGQVEDRLCAEAIQDEAQRDRQMAAVSGAIAHVVNNTLQALISYVQCPVVSEAEDLELQRAAFASADQCAALLRRFVNATRAEQPAVLEALAVVPPWILEEWRQRCPASVGLRVSGLPLLRSARVTPETLRSVTNELVANAVESLMNGQGLLHVRVSHCTLGPAALRAALPVRNRRAGIWCCVEVVDNGRGIAASELSQIWSPFYSTKFAGRGLGLAEVLSHLSALGGLVDAESEPGVGTTVRLLFPVAH